MLSRYRNGIQAGTLGIADQVLLSATNLGIGLALAREMAPAAFGIYVVTFALLLIAGSVQICMVTDPLVVLGSARQAEDQARYFGAVWRIQCWLSAGLALMAAAAALAARLVMQPGSDFPAALAGLAIAIVPLQAQTFFRSVFFTRLRPGLVLVNDLVLCVLRLSMLAWLMAAGHLSTFAVMASAGTAGLAAGGLALLTGRAWVARAGTDWLATWKEHWRFGRWLLATSVAWWCSGQAPALLASAMMTPVAAAIIKACQYLVAPLTVAFTGLDGILAPRAARIRAAGGPEAGRRFLLRVGACCGAAVVLYAGLLLPTAAPLMDWMYKGQYAGHVTIVAVLLLDALMTAIGRAPTLSLKVSGQTRTIFYATLAGAVAGVVALATLVPVYGVLGAAIAAPVSSGVTLAALLSWGMVRSGRRLPAERLSAIEP